MFKKNKAINNEFITTQYINRLILEGANRQFVISLSAIWFLQASNDPNTRESKQIAGGIIGTLENFFVQEALAIDAGVLNLFIDTISQSEYGALFEDTQPIYTAGRNEVSERFPPGTKTVNEIYDYYANLMLKTTKQDKKSMFCTLQTLAIYIDKMCGLANEAERNGF